MSIAHSSVSAVSTFYARGLVLVGPQSTFAMEHGCALGGELSRILLGIRLTEHINMRLLRLPTLSDACLPRFYVTILDSYL